MRWCAVIALCGCNQIFDLRETVHVDGGRVDSRPDSAIVCPLPGAAPRFSSRLTQAVAQTCADYTFSDASKLALAQCYVPGVAGNVFEGRLDDELAPARGFMPPAGYVIDAIRLTPVGDSAFARALDEATFSTYKFITYGRDATGTWTYQGDLGIPSAYGKILSSPTRGPLRHAILSDGDSYFYEEYAEQPDGTWLVVGMYTATDDLGVYQALPPSLSPDGLRMVFWGRGTEDRVFYAERPDLGMRFGTPIALDVPPVYDPVLNEDCTRLYFSSLDSVFFIQALAP